MDSTLVVHAMQLAGQIGTQAKTVLLWYLLARAIVPALWCGVAVFAILRASKLLGTVGKGQQLLAIVGKGSVYGVGAAAFGKAQQVLLAAFPPSDRN